MSDVGSGLFGPIEAAGLVPEALSDAAFVRAMLRFEASVAIAQAAGGDIPRDHATAIADAFRGPAPVPTELGAAATKTGTPVVALVAWLRDAVGEKAAASVHRGLTSQDVVDSASMMLASGAVRAIQVDLEAAATRLAALASEHAATPLAGRTLLQRALPTTFGAVAAGWLDGVEAGIEALARVRGGLAVQLGGPVGTAGGIGRDAGAIRAAVAGDLGLADPGAAWHTERSRVADLAGALGVAAATVGKVALDVVLLSQDELAEVSDDRPERGGSSAMAGKHNPVSAVLARSAALRAPGLVSSVLVAAGSGEHQRAAGAWHAEWRSLRELMLAVGSGAAWMRDTIEHLTPDPGRMAKNLGQAANDADLEAAANMATRSASRARVGGARAVRIHHVASGPEDAPLVVLAGSLGSTLAMWDAVAEPLSARYRVVRYDHRGHGASPAPPGPYAIADLGSDLLALLDELGGRPATVVGSSIGGMAAMWAAAHAPARVESLIVIGSAARLDPAQGWLDRAQRVLAEGTSGVAEMVVPRWVTADFAATQPQTIAACRAMFAEADPAGYAGCCLAIAGMNLTDDLARITARTLVAVGTDDISTPLDRAEAIVAGVPGARLATINGAAHVPAVDCPDEVVRLIEEHLHDR
jgi:3-carboxy-cis,cis-muconate cycloisomerase